MRGHSAVTPPPPIRPARLRQREMRTVAAPTYERALHAALSRAGSRLFTEDGDKLDLCHGYGAALLGWNDPDVEAAAGDPDASAKAEGAVAEILGARLPCAEAVSFRSSLPRALADALNAAKTVTGRDVAYFYESGGADPERTLSTLEDAQDRVAAVVVDPLDVAPTLLADLRFAADRIGAVLIFDESKCALRAHAGGAQGLSGVRPDMALLGPGLANGRPLAAVVGRIDLLRALPGAARPSAEALAAARIALTKSDRVDAVAAVRVAGAEIAAELDARLRRTGMNRVFEVCGDPSWSVLAVRRDAPGDPTRLQSFVTAQLYGHGVLCYGAHIPAWTLREAEIERLLTAYERALAALATALAKGEFERRARARRAG